MVGRADLDGEKVTDVVRRGNCTTAITTSKATTVVDWSTLATGTRTPFPWSRATRLAGSVLRSGFSTPTASLLDDDWPRALGSGSGSILRTRVHSLVATFPGIRRHHGRRDLNSEAGNG